MYRRMREHTGTKKPATEAGLLGFQSHVGTSENMSLVPEAGLEPARHYWREILSLLRALHYCLIYSVDNYV